MFTAGRKFRFELLVFAGVEPILRLRRHAQEVRQGVRVIKPSFFVNDEISSSLLPVSRTDPIALTFSLNFNIKQHATLSIMTLDA